MLTKKNTLFKLVTSLASCLYPLGQQIRFSRKNINISTIRVIYQSEMQCFSLQYNPYIIFLRGDLILSFICTSAMHILPRRAVKWCVVHLLMQNKFVVVVIVYPKRLVSLLPCFSCILCNDVSTPDKH